MQKAARNLVVWAGLAIAFNSLWELAQLPLYELWNDPDRVRVAIYLVHCILGDLLIATALFFLCALALKSLEWPTLYPFRGGALFIGMGIFYTAFSEWYNVYVAKAWSYAPAMPLIGGVGIAPLFQWLVVPIVMIIAIRRWLKNH